MAACPSAQQLTFGNGVAWLFFTPTALLLLLLLFYSLLHFRRLFRTIDVYVSAMIVRPVLHTAALVPLSIHFAIRHHLWSLIACQTFVFILHTVHFASLLLMPVLCVEVLFLGREALSRVWRTRCIKATGLAILWCIGAILAAIIPVFLWSENKAKPCGSALGLCPFLPHQLNHGYAIAWATLSLTAIFFVVICAIDSTGRMLHVSKTAACRNPNTNQPSVRSMYRNWVIIMIINVSITVLNLVPQVVSDIAI